MSTQKLSANALKFAEKYRNVSGTGVSRDYITFSYVDGVAKEKENKKTGEIETIYVERKAKKGEVIIPKKLVIVRQEDSYGQHLLLCKDVVTVATFTFGMDTELSFNPTFYWDDPVDYIAIPTNTKFKPIESVSNSDFFSQWLTSPQFAEHLSILAERRTYTPKLVKLLLLWVAYQTERSNLSASTGRLTEQLDVDLNNVAGIFQGYIAALTGEVAYMQRLYSVDEKFTLSPAKPTTPAIESIQVTPSTPDV